MKSPRRLARDAVVSALNASVGWAYRSEHHPRVGSQITCWANHFVRSGYSMAAVAGTPSITVPSARFRGLPLGLTIMGRPYSEPQLIGFAYALEQKA